MRNGATLTRSIPLWLLRIAWITLPLTAGPAASATVSDWSDGPRVVAEVLLWLAWGAGLLATIAPRPQALTALRTIAPAFLVFAIAAAFDGQASTTATVAALVATALTAVLISTWWVPGLRITLKAGVPWLVFISLCYLVWRKVRSPKISDGVLQDG
jgi:hypothetical protein